MLCGLQEITRKVMDYLLATGYYSIMNPLSDERHL